MKVKKIIAEDLLYLLTPFSHRNFTSRNHGFFKESTCNEEVKCCAIVDVYMLHNICIAK